MDSIFLTIKSCEYCSRVEKKKKKKKLKTENVSVEFKRLLYLFLLPWGEIRWILPQQDRPLRKVCSRLIVGRPCTSNRITR